MIARRLILWLSLALTAPAPAWAAAADVLVVVSEEQGAYREVVEAVRAELARPPAQRVNLRIVAAAAFDATAHDGVQAAVAIGTRAARTLAGSRLHAPVIATLLPRAAFDRIAVESGRNVEGRRLTAVFLDQPPGRQLELVRIALPGTKNLGVLVGPESESLLLALQTAAAERRIKLTTPRVADEKELYSALQRLLADADVLLALPDPAVFNANTVPDILLASYRQGVPVVGFSPAYVRAGAVAAVYTTPAQLGAQTGEALRTLLTAGTLPPPQYPRYFTVSTNAYVARSLNRTIDDATALQKRLSAAERMN